VDPQVKRALSQALRVEILERIAANPASPRQIAEVAGEPLPRVAYHASVLHQTGCVRPTSPEAAASGPYDCVYELATLLPSPPRLQLSDATRGHALASVLQRIVEQGLTALQGGTLGRREDNRASCQSVVLDEQGWQEMQAILEETAGRLAALRAAASRRLAASGEPAITTIIAFTAFEAPAEGTPPR
jgi:hypothetical protein